MRKLIGLKLISNNGYYMFGIADIGTVFKVKELEIKDKAVYPNKVTFENNNYVSYFTSDWRSNNRVDIKPLFEPIYEKFSLLDAMPGDKFKIINSEANSERLNNLTKFLPDGTILTLARCIARPYSQGEYEVTFDSLHVITLNEELKIFPSRPPILEYIG